MKHIYFLFIVCITLIGCNQSKAKKEPINYSEKLGQTPIVLAYVTGGGETLPDPSYVTHINYAFGHITDSFDGIAISNEARLKEIVALKDKNLYLKIMLSIGGWTSGRFSEMASDSLYRLSFAKDCKRIIDDFGIDGVDLDWEYPTSSMAGISSSPHDTENFTRLMRDIRQQIGDDKLLTLASSSSAHYIDFRAIDEYIDFVNIMTYDMGRPPYHNAPLFHSKYTRHLSADESVTAHIAAGVPLIKLTLGMPFYGHGVDSISDFIDYKDVINLEGYTSRWDSIAQVPYLVDETGKFVCSYDDPQSLKLKCRYALDKGMLGVMYWEYNCDDVDGSLRKVVYDTMMQK